MMKTIQEIVLSACNGTEKDWTTHIKRVVSYATTLAEKLQADPEVCEIAAWLHDLTKIRGYPEDHHITGADAARRLLESRVPKDKIEHISSCIQSHSSDPTYPPTTTEAKILACADALAHLDHLLWVVTDHVFFTQNISFEKERISSKTQKASKKLCLKEAQLMAEPKAHAIICLLEKVTN